MLADWNIFGQHLDSHRHLFETDADSGDGMARRCVPVHWAIFLLKMSCSESSPLVLPRSQEKRVTCGWTTVAVAMPVILGLAGG